VVESTQQAEGDGGLEAFAEVNRAVVVCAHADDMETMMGGTIALLVERGVEFYELICTRGDLGSHDERITRVELATLRDAEAREAGRLLGVREVVTLNRPDGELEADLDLRAAVAGYYRRWQPDTLFTFDPSWAGQIHPDHREAGRAAIDALMPSKMRLYRPDQLLVAKVADVKRAFLFGAVGPSVFVDVTAIYGRKLEACIAHRSQFPGGEESLNWMKDLDSAAAQRAGTGANLVEAFTALRLW